MGRPRLPPPFAQTRLIEPVRVRAKEPMQSSSFSMPSPRAPRLAPFFALSALAHVLLLALFPVAQPPAAVLPLKLSLAQLAASSAPETPAKKASPAPAPAPSPAVPEAIPAAEPEATPVESQAAAAKPAAGTEHLAEPLDATVLAHVQAAMSRHFSYPLLARRKGWQGEVLLSFRVTVDGKIDEVRVVRSSGHKLLDEAARTSLARVGNLPDYPMHGGAPRHLQIPVIFRLAEG